jgi:two-component system, OmpR family, KDP operon response regulator KdpE
MQFPTTDPRIQIGELRIDLEARRVFIGETDLHLTRTEYAILAKLAQHLDAIVTHDELIAQVWGAEYRGSNHYLHNYMGRLRKKLGAYSEQLETIPGMGYNLHSKKTNLPPSDED